MQLCNKTLHTAQQISMKRRVCGEVCHATALAQDIDSEKAGRQETLQNA